MTWIGLLAAAPAWAGSWGADEGAWGKGAGGLRVEEPLVVGDLAIFPVVGGSEGADAPVGTLGPAIVRGEVTVQEAPNGRVDQLLVTNRGAEPVLAMAGDVFQGGMQDRVLQSSLLVAGGRSALVPVRCIERARWSGASRGFVYAGRVDPMLRSRLAEGATQDETWALVGAQNRARGVAPTESWLASRDLDRAELATVERAFRARYGDDEPVMGVIVARSSPAGYRFVSAELYPQASLFEADRLAVWTSHLAAPSRQTARPAAPPSVDDAVAWLEAELDTSGT